jgi:hypothetical protein
MTLCVDVSDIIIHGLDADQIATANTMAAWVIQNGVDGIDVDYEVCFLPITKSVCLLNETLGFQRYECSGW